MNTKTATTCEAIRVLNDIELDAVNGGLYAFAMPHYWFACAALGVYLGSN